MRAAAGRLFAPGDEASLTERPVVVLGHAMWRRRFGADPAIVGATIHLQRGAPVPVVVAGVLPEDFRDLDAAADRDLWMPPQTWMLLESRATFERTADRWFDVLGIRRPQVARAELAAPDHVRLDDEEKLAGLRAMIWYMSKQTCVIKATSNKQRNFWRSPIPRQARKKMGRPRAAADSQKMVRRMLRGKRSKYAPGFLPAPYLGRGAYRFTQS